MPYEKFPFCCASSNSVVIESKEINMSKNDAKLDESILIVRRKSEPNQGSTSMYELPTAKEFWTNDRIERLAGIISKFQINKYEPSSSTFCTPQPLSRG